MRSRLGGVATSQLGPSSASVRIASDEFAAATGLETARRRIAEAMLAAGKHPL